MTIPTSTAYKNAIYGTSRAIHSQFDFTFQGTKTTYDDTRVISANIVEEVFPLNDSVPSNEITLTVDNTDNAFNIPINDLPQVIASKPQIDFRFGLDLGPVQTISGATIKADYAGKVKGSLVENGHYAMVDVNNSAVATPIPPSVADTESTAQYTQIYPLDGTYYNRWSGARTKQTYSARYIRDTVNGSTANANAYWNTIKAMQGGVDLAQGKLPTTNGTAGNFVNITDGNDTTYGYVAATGSWYAQIDLGSIQALDSVQIIHYYLDGRTFHNVLTQISTDGVTWTTLYDSTVSGEYVETSAGKTYAPTPQYWLAQHWFMFDITRMMKDYYGSAYFGSVTDKPSQIQLALQAITAIQLNWTGYGFGGATSKDAHLAVWNPNTQSYDQVVTDTNTAQTLRLVTLSVTNFSSYIDSSGFITFIAYSSTADTVNGSAINTDYAQCQITTKDTTSGGNEWIPMGTFFVDSWKVDSSGMTVTLTGHDNLMNLENIDFPATSATNLYDLAVAVFTTAGITNYNIDDVYSQVTTAGTFESTNCRETLQNIAIAGQGCIYQDRYGVIQLTRIEFLDESANYLNYATTGPSLWGYTSQTNNMEISNEGGMGYIDSANMYDLPDVDLDKSIYQLIINVYNTSGVLTSTVTRTNTALEGTNGESFTIQNPLIIDTLTAQQVGDWYFRETQKNIIYTMNWRANPCLEASDILTINTPTIVKQARIYKNEFDYDATLSGNAEMHGGV